MQRQSLLAFMAVALLATAPRSRSSIEPLFAVGGEVKAPVKTKDCKPAFPPWVMKQRITQPVFTYEAIISSRGNVTSVRRTNIHPLKEPYSTIDAEFRKVILCWRYKPASRRGRPVACKYGIVARVEVR